MKSAIYTKADQVGLAEIDRPQIEAPDDAIIRAFVVPTSGVTVIQTLKRGTEIVVMRLSESSKNR